MNNNKTVFTFLWDAWCCLSVIGIWPRFIEPKLIQKTFLDLDLPNFPDNLKIAQISDLHLNQYQSDHFLQKIQKKVLSFQPDLIVFTGDFICGSALENPNRLQQFLNGFSAPYGCYAVLGNHDYNKYVSVTFEGDYDLIDSNFMPLGSGWKRLFKNITLTKKFGSGIEHVSLHQELLDLLKKTPFRLLHNETLQLSIRDRMLNLTGLGDYTLNKCDPEKAFKGYKPDSPGIVLTHNPDSIKLFKNNPAQLILCGHTHGGQVNLPFLWKKFTLLENESYKRGLIKQDSTWVYVNRGLGSGMHFRWFSMPEVLLLTLKEKR